MVLTLKELLASVWFSKGGPWICYQHLLKVQFPRSHPKLTESESPRTILGLCIFNLRGTNTVWEASLELMLTVSQQLCGLCYHSGNIYIVTNIP